MGVRQAHDLEQPLDASVLADGAVQGIEHNVRLDLGQGCRQVSGYVDASHAKAALGKRTLHGITGHQRHLALGGPAAL